MASVKQSRGFIKIWSSLSRRFSRVSIVGKIFLDCSTDSQLLTQQYLLRYLNRLGKFDKSE